MRPGDDPVETPLGTPIKTAELLAVGSELTTGDTRDTNGGELAHALAASGVTVRRISALPDDLQLVTDAFTTALGTVDLVVATGGLGPTPDDLTREALAAAIGEAPSVDPVLERHLRALFRRRRMELPAINLKQAWLVPSAASIPNPNGTAPGWWVDRPDGRVVVLLPGPPREMRPMWHDWVMPRLQGRGLGDGRVVRTLRTYGIGESHVAERLGEPMLRAANPLVATYARTEWLDIRITAVDEVDAEGRTLRSGETLLDETDRRVRELLGGHVLAEDDTSWGDLVQEAATSAGVRVAISEWGTHGALAGLLAEVPALARATVAGPEPPLDPSAAAVGALAEDTAEAAGVPVGVALVARSGDRDTHLRVGVTVPGAVEPRVLELRLFQHGPHGRLRAGVAAAAFLVEVLAGSAEGRTT